MRSIQWCLVLKKALLQNRVNGIARGVYFYHGMGGNIRCRKGIFLMVVGPWLATLAPPAVKDTFNTIHNRALKKRLTKRQSR